MPLLLPIAIVIFMWRAVSQFQHFVHSQLQILDLDSTAQIKENDQQSPCVERNGWNRFFHVLLSIQMYRFVQCENEV